MTDKMKDYKLDRQFYISYRRDNEPSKEIKDVARAILKFQNDKLRELLKNPKLNINEKFDTIYSEEDDILTFSLMNGNIDAFKILLEHKGFNLDDESRQRLLMELLFQRRFLLMVKTFNSISRDGKIAFMDYLKAVIKQDANCLKKTKIEEKIS